MNTTAIEWTDYTANPIKFRDSAGRVVWGCVHASPGCQHCYAETLAKRYGKGGPFNVPTMAGLTPFLDEAELHRMLTYKPASGKRVFVGDMTDIFGEWVPDALLDRLFAVFALRTDVTWQVLTKRADRMRAYLSTSLARVNDAIAEIHTDATATRFGGPGGIQADAIPRAGWPLPNVWVGVSAEDQQRADERIPLLLQTPAAVRFVSAEPLLGPVDISRWVDALNWIIVGGESGPGARTCETNWIRSLIDQARAAGVACFVKQVGSKPLDAQATVRNLVEALAATGAFMKDRKGGNPDDWAPHMRVREFPS